MKSSIKLQVVVDTNVLISGILYGGKPEKIIKNWRKQVFSLFVSPFLLKEVFSVIKKLSSISSQIKTVKDELENNSIKIIPFQVANICRDEKDNQILDLCFAGKADYLVTGDKDLLVLKKFGKTRIITPKDFLLIISR